MYGLPDSAIYGTYKRARRSMKPAKRGDNTTYIYNPKALDKAQGDEEFLGFAILLPLMALGKLFDFIGSSAERIGNRAERWDRKMRAKRARQMLDAKKKVL
jgi:acyl-homoserine lactone acylase PvdQ